MASVLVLACVTRAQQKRQGISTSVPLNPYVATIPPTQHTRTKRIRLPAKKDLYPAASKAEWAMPVKMFPSHVHRHATLEVRDAGDRCNIGCYHVPSICTPLRATGDSVRRALAESRRAKTSPFAWASSLASNLMSMGPGGGEHVPSDWAAAPHASILAPRIQTECLCVRIRHQQQVVLHDAEIPQRHTTPWR